MPKIKLTHRGIEQLTAGKWLTDYLDDTLTGFGVRVHHTGRKAFFVRYDLGTGRKRLTIGTYPTLSLADARDQAKDLLGRVARGEDPQEEKRADRDAITFRELAEQYLELHAKRHKKRWREDERILKVDLLPAWRRKKAKDIGRRDVAELLDGIVERGAPIMANRTKALISKIYNFGLSRDLVDHNPCLGVPMPAKAKQRDRVLSEDEIRSLWRALDDLEPVMAATFKMRLLTAQRGVEVLSMRWEHIDGDWWTIPAEVSKNGLTHRVSLAPQTQQLLEQLRPLTGDSEWVFASPRKPNAHITAVQKAAERLVRETEVSFVPHDLRRTAASFMTSMGVSRLVVSKILNHVESGITAVYDRHSYDAEKREALELWGQRLEQIVTEAPRAVDPPSQESGRGPDEYQ
jgi:integrase